MLHQAIKQVPTAGPITVSEFETGGGIRHFFGTRHFPTDMRYALHGSVPTQTGASDVPCAVVSVKQVHGHDALIVDTPVKAETIFDGGWDAIVTNQPGVLATIRTADCVPVLVHDPIRRVVAAIHSGWRGSVAQIVPRTIDVMRRTFGTQAGSVHVAIGPSAGVCCYEVDDPVLKPLQAFSFASSVIRKIGPGRALLDLRAFIRAQTLDLGVHESRVWVVDLCTICQPNIFHSYRRDGTAKQTMTSGIMLWTRR